MSREGLPPHAPRADAPHICRGACHCPGSAPRRGSCRRRQGAVYLHGHASPQQFERDHEQPLLRPQADQDSLDVGQRAPEDADPAALAQIGIAAHDRQVIDDLMACENTGDVARKFGLSPGRVSQLRRQFEGDWAVFCYDPTFA